MFQDRIEAGKALAAAVAARKPERPVVLALPRGGVPVAAEVARVLDAPLGLLIVRKIGAPGHEELAVGAVGDGDPPVTVFNPEILAALGLTEADFDQKVAGKVAEIGARRRLYLDDRPQPSVEGATAIVVDDGIATGATVRAALDVLKRQGAARIVLAVPVAPADTVAELRRLVDEVVCLETPEPFVAVGAHYARFGQTSDDEVVALLKAAQAR
jgi:putative phosphoribosyl transferase